MPLRSLADFLDLFLRHGRYVACVHRRGYRTARWTYRRLAEAAAQAARELDARGIAKGDRVLIWGENCAEWLVAFWGCVPHGANAAPLDRIAMAYFASRLL